MMMKQPSNTLYTALTAAFCVIVVVSNIISAKLLAVPFFDQFAIPAGLMTYPLTFLISDLTTEIFGSAQAKKMVYMALGMTILSYLIIQAALLLPSPHPENHRTFQSVMGLNGILVFASLVAYVLGQIIDIQLYSWIKNKTGERFLWLRNNGSTLVSQIVDTIAVNTIFLYWGFGMEFPVVVQIILFSYAYKAFFSVANTPLFYLFVYLVKGKTPLSNHSWNIPLKTNRKLETFNV
jgi:hypothetical protein